MTVALLASMLVPGAVLALAAEPEWQGTILREEPLPADCGTLRIVTFSPSILSATGDRQPFTVTAVLFEPGRVRAAIVDQPREQPGPDDGVAGIARRCSAVVAINGGYFAPGFRTDGLCVVGHARLAPLSDAAVLSGVVAIDDGGALALLPRAQAPADPACAVQAGPFVVDPGGALGVRPQVAARRRTLLALDTRGRTMALVSSPVSLSDLGWTLCHRAPAYGVEGVERALNLDGGPSSALALAGPLARHGIAELGPVRNVVTFVRLATAR